MKISALLATALAVAPSAWAAGKMKSAIIMFEDAKTPDSVIQQAKNSVVQAGGKITHEYTLIKGFSVVAPEEALQTMKASNKDYGMRVEEDKMMSTDE
ncbi:hypothetical protein CDD81_8150 [Ophiocordyceps australis]|uniref:Inhibitor I9 domain-containing protein n=1 Tax=Ophiocordyceps australis TaxID=1399860 RepID=A0A2C5X8Q0_9HYPO|nr:hypothetical protein CDD81_8150 [Ophiocordyceps australis]